MDERGFHDISMIDEEQYIAEEIVNKNLAGFFEFMEVDYQLEHSDKRNLKKHNKLYTKLLSQYVENFIDISNSKKKYKDAFILILLIMMVGIPIAVFVFLYYAIENYMGVDNLPAIISGTLTAMVSLVSVFVAIPKIVTKYLFNEKEEENMTIIIKNIQDYDKQIRFNSNSVSEESTSQSS